jgi:hypothetical protein
MNLPLAQLALALKNPHTSVAALAFAFVKVGSRIAEAWCPQYKSPIETTADALEGLAVLYLGLAAGDASQGLSKSEADTTFVKKP